MPVRMNARLRAHSLLVLLLALVLAPACVGRAQPVQRSQAIPGLRVDDRALRQWHYLYSSVREVEWLTCLYGTVRGTDVHVARSELADIATTGYAEVSGRCHPDTEFALIGVAHSHPPLPDGAPSCLPSPTDERALGSAWHIIVVVCDTQPGAVRVGYRTHGRNPVITSLAVRETLPPLVLGNEEPR